MRRARRRAHRHRRRRDVAVATREAVAGDDLDELETDVLATFRADIETERIEHAEATRLQLAAIRQIMRHLRPPTSGVGSGT